MEPMIVLIPFLQLLYVATAWFVDSMLRDHFWVRPRRAFWLSWFWVVTVPVMAVIGLWRVLHADHS